PRRGARRGVSNLRVITFNQPQKENNVIGEMDLWTKNGDPSLFLRQAFMAWKPRPLEPSDRQEMSTCGAKRGGSCAPSLAAVKVALPPCGLYLMQQGKATLAGSKFRKYKELSAGISCDTGGLQSPRVTRCTEPAGAGPGAPR